MLQNQDARFRFELRDEAAITNDLRAPTRFANRARLEIGSGGHDVLFRGSPIKSLFLGVIVLGTSCVRTE
jgi:hypothetical protein